MADVKICGITEETALKAAIDAGARYVGFVFYPDSPRYITPEDAHKLLQPTPPSVRTVALFVNPADKELYKIKERETNKRGFDMIQLHGDETPERILEIKALSGKPVIKAIHIATKYDMELLPGYEAAADWLLFDSKPAGADLPGGTGQSFDWSILKGQSFSKPWMLSGGLTEDNVAAAISILNPKVVDVSSGVENKKGIKDPEKIKDFIRIVKNNG